MTHQPLGFQLSFSKANDQATSYGGVVVFLELLHRSGLLRQIKHLGPKLRGHKAHWQDFHYIVLFLMLNWIGAEAVSDRDHLINDKALVSIYHTALRSYLPRSKRYKSGLPSVASCLRYLKDQGLTSLKDFWSCNEALLRFMQAQTPSKTATLDLDATVIATQKREAQYCYLGHKAYQPLNLYWAEQQALVLSDFREGNVNASSGLLSLVKQGLEILPRGIEKKYLRSDAAGYQKELIQGCLDLDLGFTVSGIISRSVRAEAGSLPASAWSELKDKEGFTVGEYAGIAHPSDTIPKAVRYLLVRRQLSPQLELEDGDLTSKQAIINGKRYRLAIVVTNRKDLTDNDLIQWHYERCGYSEDFHRTIKDDLAGGTLPCGHFEANGFWWLMACWAFQLHSLMRRFLSARFRTARVKTLRWHLVNLPGRCIQHARGIFFQFSQEAFAVLNETRQRIIAAHDPPCAA